MYSESKSIRTPFGFSANQARMARSSLNDYLDRRKTFEQIVAGAALLLCLPLLALLAGLIRLTSPGPAVYRQCRVGQNGRLFTMYKLRSMRSDAEAGSGPVWCRPGDLRVTLIGRLLRWSHLDELPQLYNVARGEMSLIGPRPERPEIVAQLEGEIDGYRDRLNILPGLTGLAQVTLPPDTSTDSVKRKLLLDRRYIQTVSFKLDLHILFCTALLVFGVRRSVCSDTWDQLSRL